MPRCSHCQSEAVEYNPNVRSDGTNFLYCGLCAIIFTDVWAAAHMLRPIEKLPIEAKSYTFEWWADIRRGN